MSSDAMVRIALKLLGCNQKELAARLNVSQSQITKWKQGEYMSLDMESAVRDLLQIGEMCPELIIWAGDLESAQRWARLIAHLAQNAEFSAETGYATAPLADEPDLLCSHLIDALNAMGVKPPHTFPPELDIDYDDPESDFDSLESHTVVALIADIFRSYTDVYGFYLAYVYDIVWDESLNLTETPADNIESSLLALAASKLNVDEFLAPRFREFRFEVNRDFEDWLSIVRKAAFRAGIPLKAELLDLIYKSHDEVGHAAEAESLGFNDNRLHPDVYMNELLVGMRVIHQVLPAILKKLGIDSEFVLNESELSQGGVSH